jgi:hypothetical protein
LGAGESDFLPVFERHVPRPNLISRSEGGWGRGQSILVEEAQDKSRGGPEKSEGCGLRLCVWRPGRHGRMMVADWRGVGRINQGDRFSR